MRRVLTMLSALILMLGGFTIAAAPAQAATINGCKAAYICFYDWTGTNYASGFWQRPLYGADSVLTSNDFGISGCMNLNDMYWHDLDGLVYDTASSMIINQYNPARYRVSVYDWINCSYNAANADWEIAPNELVIENNLHTVQDCDTGGCGVSWYDRISSIRVQRYA